MGARELAPRSVAVMLLGAATVFLAAFLLFQIQPMIAKVILPWFGGAAGVWTTCMLFFQGLLLGAYLYAHGLVRVLKPRKQAWLHGGLLAVSLLLLPLAPGEAWKPAGTEDPAFRILALLGATVGLPYFLLSATGPLVQAWYAQARGAVPYRLFAVSNAGALLGLVTYPVLTEPFLTTRHQLRGWSVAYAACALLCAMLAFRFTGAGEPAAMEAGGEDPSRAVKLLWIALPACGSILLLSVTNHLTKDVAPAPFLWVLPLSLYLFSFVLCFGGGGWYRRDWYSRLLLLAFAGLAVGMSGFGEAIGLPVNLVLFGGGLFLCCMVCHGELARLKPGSRHVTEFYLMVALGGALGGVLVGLLAPRLFSGYYELPIGVCGCGALLVAVLLRDPGQQRPRLLLTAGSAALVLWYVLFQSGVFARDARLVVRNFYGVLRVDESAGANQGEARRRLRSGTVNHGEQFLDAGRRRDPTAYYGPRSGVGLALLETGRPTPQRVGVIGLGAGVLACYGRPGDFYRFYEINPLVIRLAKAEFSFLEDCPARVDIVQGDGRLALERERPQEFDVLAVDAFSGDAVPVHLLTREAFALYFRHLKPGGILAVHVSNKYLKLDPIVELGARALGEQAITVTDQGDRGKGLLSSTWVLASGSREVFERPALQKAAVRTEIKPGVRFWTDDSSNLLRSLK